MASNEKVDNYKVSQLSKIKSFRFTSFSIRGHLGPSLEHRHVYLPGGAHKTASNENVDNYKVSQLSKITFFRFTSFSIRGHLGPVCIWNTDRSICLVGPTR